MAQYILTSCDKSLAVKIPFFFFLPKTPFRNLRSLDEVSKIEVGLRRGGEGQFTTGGTSDVITSRL